MKFASCRRMLGSGLLAASLLLPACKPKYAAEENEPEYSMSLENDYKHVTERQFMGALESMRHSKMPGNEFEEFGGMFHENIYTAGFDSDGNGALDYILVARERTDEKGKTYAIAAISSNNSRFNSFSNELLK